MGDVSTGMGDHLSSTPAMGCVCAQICFCHQTFINSITLLVFLMAVQLTHVDRKTFQSCSLNTFSFFRVEAILVW